MRRFATFVALATCACGHSSNDGPGSAGSATAPAAGSSKPAPPAPATPVKRRRHTAIPVEALEHQYIATTGIAALLYDNPPVDAVGLVLRKRDGQVVPWCTATLSGCDVALTARHCVSELGKAISSDELGVFFPSAGYFAVASVAFSNASGTAHDVGVLYLSGKPDLRHAAWDATKHAHHDGLITGMGDGQPSQDDQDPESGLRRTAEVSFMPCSSGSGYCWSYTPTVLDHLDATTLSDLGLQPGTTCAGDSGGPLFDGSTQIGVHTGGTASTCGTTDNAVDASFADSAHEVSSWLSSHQSCAPTAFTTWVEAGSRPQGYSLEVPAQYHELRVAVDTTSAQPAPTVRILDPNNQTLCESTGTNVWAYCSVKTDGDGEYAIDITGAPVWTQVTFGVR